MIELLLDFLLQLIVYLLRMPILNLLEKFISYLFSNSNTNDKVLDILHKSDNFIIVNKPYDILINSDDVNVKPTVQTLLKERYPDLANTNLYHEFHFANRLDYSTSGVLCVALHKKSCAAAVKAFETRTAKKYYLALLRGLLQNECINIDEPIGEDKRHKQDNHKMCVASNDNCEGAREASTRILILATGLFNGKDATKVLIKPCTGRRHQIRVHCQFIGHPIVGDYTYGSQEDKEPYRMFLHSYRLILPNAIEDVDVQAKDPFLETDPKNTWIPRQIINKLEESTFEKIDNDILNALCKN